MSEIPFTQAQINLIDKAVEWYKRITAGRAVKSFGEFCNQRNLSPDNRSSALEYIAYSQRAGQKFQSQLVFKIFGFAGCGKTTIAREIEERTKAITAYIAQTGKAASVLRKKGCEGAMTVCRFAFKPLGEDDEGKPIFGPRLDPYTMPQLIVLDEGSMVGRREAQQLLTFGIPMIVLLDPAQLKPVASTAPFIDGEPDGWLTETKRNGGNILRAAMYVREGKRLPDREYDDIQIRSRMPSLPELIDHSGLSAQILCARNKTRNRINRQVRAHLGFTHWLPMRGDKLIATCNDYGADVINGSQWIVLEDVELSDDVPRYDVEFRKGPFADSEFFTSGPRGYVKVMSLDEPDRVTTLHINTDCFLEPDVSAKQDAIRKEGFKQYGGFDFGYAITVHKSQGSEWDSVLYIEESIPGCEQQSLDYTGLTRAAKNLSWYRVK